MKDKIVRIHYNCSADNSKTLDKTLVEKTLMNDGAFMVWEILPVSIPLTRKSSLTSYLAYLNEK